MKNQAAAVLALLALSFPSGFCAPAEPVKTSSPAYPIHPAGGDFPSRYLNQSLRVCPGTPWPRETESMMMPLLAANRDEFRGKRVLDIGTGSGILAVYAALSGAASVVATDIDTRAVACVLENARRSGLNSVIEARLVRLEDPSAYAVVHPGETFDVILSAPPDEFDRTPVVSSGAVREEIPQNDHVTLGFSIIDGLRTRLSRNGAAVLYYGSIITHSLMVGYARQSGYAVNHHPALYLRPADVCALYNFAAAQVARTEHVDPGVLLKPLTENLDCELAVGRYFDIHWQDEGASFPRLWSRDTGEAFPGMIVIRNSPAPAFKEEAR